MSTNMQLLKRGFLFENLSEVELQSLVALVDERNYTAGSYIFMEGSQATSMFVIQSGTVEILKEGSAGTKFVVAQLTEGTHFGEMAFVDRAPRAAASMATSDTRLIEVKYVDLERIVATQPLVGLKLYHSLAKTLCERIRQTTTDLTHLILS